MKQMTNLEIEMLMCIVAAVGWYLGYLHSQTNINYKQLNK
jgi:hypothetical protein